MSFTTRRIAWPRLQLTTVESLRKDLNDQDVPVTPDPASPDFPKLRRHFGSVRGAWPVIRQ
jgi:hypothetical protein